jgi:N-acetylmuramoyl-L-alanine amidase
MLKTVRKAMRFAVLLALAAATAAVASAGKYAQQAGPPQQPAQSGSAPGQPPSGSPPAQSGQRILQTIVLDPAHGGTDEGTHGSGGIVEKDVVLTLAQAVQTRLARDGWRVVMTRQGDQTFSFEQRAAIANAQPDAIFISLHVGSSGPQGSANVYYYDFNQVIENQPETAGGGLVSWNRAQSGWQTLSQRLAELLQVELSERLQGTGELPAGAPVYQLREIAEPAVAIEVENINAPSAPALDALGTPLAEAISRAIQAFRMVYQAGAQ